MPCFSHYQFDVPWNIKPEILMKEAPAVGVRVSLWIKFFPLLSFPFRPNRDGKETSNMLFKMFICLLLYPESSHKVSIFIYIRTTVFYSQCILLIQIQILFLCHSVCMMSDHITEGGECLVKHSKPCHWEMLRA